MNPERENITVGVPTMGATPSDYIKNHALDTKATAGVVGQPTIGMGFLPTVHPGVDTTNADTTLNTTYNHADLSTRISPQDIPEKGRNQFEFHG